MAKLSEDGRTLKCERTQRQWHFGSAQQAARHLTPEFLAEVERDDVAPTPQPSPGPTDPAPITTRDEAKTAMQRLLDWLA